MEINAKSTIFRGFSLLREGTFVHDTGGFTSGYNQGESQVERRSFACCPVLVLVDRLGNQGSSNLEIGAKYLVWHVPGL